MAQLTHSPDEEWTTALAVAAASPAVPFADRVRAFLTGSYPTLLSRLVLGGSASSPG